MDGTKANLQLLQDLCQKLLGLILMDNFAKMPRRVSAITSILCFCICAACSISQIDNGTRHLSVHLPLQLSHDNFVWLRSSSCRNDICPCDLQE